MIKRYFNSPFLLCLTLCVLTLIIRLFIAADTGLGVGESYYVRGVVDLQLSYFDQPPLFFWISSLSTKLFGFSNLGLRIPAILLFFGTSMLVYDTAKWLYRDWAGFYAVLLMNIAFVFTLPIATWFQPDAPLMFFWMLCVWAVVKLFFRKTTLPYKKGSSLLLWLIIGISTGLASLSKYHSVFLIFGILMFIISNKQNRHWLMHPEPYVALLITFLFLLPVLIWNHENNWISFNFQGSRAGTGNGLKFHFDWLARSIIGQSIWLLPWVWFWLIQQLFRTTKQLFRSTVQSFFFWMSVTPILFFTLVNLWANTHFHFHWQAPGYMILFIPLGNEFYEKSKIEPLKIKRKLIISSFVFVFLSAIVTVQMTTGFWQFYGPRQITKAVGGSYDPTIEGVDFNEIKVRFEKEGWLTNENIFVGSVGWWQAGKIDWPLLCKKEMLIFSNDPRNYAYFSHPQQLLGKDAIVVRFPKKNEHLPIDRYFNSINRLPNIDIVRGGVTELSLEVFYCTNFHKPNPIDFNDVIDRQLVGEKPF